jgi:L-ribulose-5-phosphate 3-epimerase
MWVDSQSVLFQIFFQRITMTVQRRSRPSNQSALSRRRFTQTTASALLGAPLGLGWLWEKSFAGELASQGFPSLSDDDNSLKGRIWKTLKIGMTQGVAGGLVEQFKAAREAGFDGIEMDSPGMSVEQTRQAIAESGLPVDGTVCSTHWQIRHTSPEAEVRKKALQDLQTAIRDTDAVGGKTVLLVAGHGNDGPLEEIWERAVENISQAIPLAAQLGIKIAIENVWNHFMYDHNGGAEQTAELYVRFVDELNSPWVGMQFDIGNHWKYGSMGDWIRQLKHRVVKLDVKGYSRGRQAWADIGEGDIDWADVRAALKEINYFGWAAAEVGGGDLNRLKVISQQMDRVFLL